MYKGINKRKSRRLIFQDTVPTSQENTCSGRKYSASILFARQPQIHMEIECILTQGWGSLVGCRLWGRTESDMTEVT